MGSNCVAALSFMVHEPRRNHGVGQRQVFVLQMLQVPHHGGFRPVSIENGVVQVIHGPQLTAQWRGKDRPCPAKSPH